MSNSISQLKPAEPCAAAQATFFTPCTSATMPAFFVCLFDWSTFDLTARSMSVEDGSPEQPLKAEAAKRALAMEMARRWFMVSP
jgi:hypothetical protein